MFERLKKKINQYCSNKGITIRTLFRQIDEDADKCIDVPEFKRACQEYFDMNVLTKEENRALLKAVFRKFDQNGDWLIWMEEFISTLQGSEFSQNDFKEFLGKMRKNIDIENDAEI
jgi:EF-hand domain pair